MASVYFERLARKYGKKNLTGRRYEKMVSEILAHNDEKIGRAIARLSDDHYRESVKNLKRSKQKIVKLPDLTTVIPKRSVFIVKGAEQGRFISQTLRTRLESDLRSTLLDYEGKKLPKMEIQRGKATGRLNPALIDTFRSRITKTFESSVKRDKLTGVPPNIRNIAVTEIRSTMSMVKKEYNNQLLAENPGMKMKKTWIHNRMLSKVPRKNHMRMHGVSVAYGKSFKVPRSKGRGFDIMDRPHDPAAPRDQVIGCSCEAIYRAII